MARNAAGRKWLHRVVGAGVPLADKLRVANRAARDAGRLSTDLRCQDPAEVWRTLVRWSINEPDRLVAVAFAALAMTPDDRSHRDLLAWIDQMAPVLTVVRDDQRPARRAQ